MLAALLHGTLVVGVSQTAALNRGRHLYSAGRPSGWALAHISSFYCFVLGLLTCLSLSPHQCQGHDVDDGGDVFDSILGRGAFGDVYEASLITSEDGFHATAVAVKVLYVLCASQ